MHLFGSTVEVFKRQALWLLYAEALAQLAVFGFLDYITGYELAVYPIYSVPILFMVWFGGRTPAVVISVVSTLVWWWADVAAGHLYSNTWLQAWDVVVRLFYFLVVAFAGWTFKETRDTMDARVRLLERSQRLESEIISVSERERQRIGRDLHDGVCQYLAAIGLTADLLRQNLALERHPRADAAGEIAALLQDAVGPRPRGRTRPVAGRPRRRRPGKRAGGIGQQHHPADRDRLRLHLPGAVAGARQHPRRPPVPHRAGGRRQRHPPCPRPPHHHRPGSR